MGFLFGGGSAPAAQQPNIAAGLRIQTSIYGKAKPLMWGLNRIAANLIWYNDFTAIPVQQGGGGGGGGKGGSGGGGGKGGGGGSTTYNYQVAVMMALGEGPIQNTGKVWSNAASYPSIAAAGFGVFVGSYSQTPWSYVTSTHPTEARNYRGLANVVSSALQLGSNPQLPQYSWEVYGLDGFSFNPGGGIWDCAPNAVITDFLTNINYGVGFDTDQVGDFITGNDSYYRFCVANDLLISPFLMSQEAAATTLDRWLMLTISGPVWSEGVLKIIPFSTETATGNGVTFTPNVTPEYDITDNDYYYKKGAMPVTQIRTDPADAYNAITVECLNRDNDYNMGLAEWRDQGMVDQYGLRPSQSVFKAHEIMLLTRAATCAQLMGQRQLYIRRKFKFALPINFCRLEPMDLITLTDANLNLDRQLVRIIEIQEGEEQNGVLEITAEEVLIGIAAPANYSSQASLGHIPNFNVAPPDTETPILFAPPLELSETLQLFLAACGDAGWGGCEIWVSSDGNTYGKQGVIHAPARMGELLAVLPVGSDPDTVNTLEVDLSESSGTLISGTQADADTGNTICYVDGEFISYQTATLTAPSEYDLTYLRRGFYQSLIASHAIGSKFARIDEAVFGLPYTPDQIGKTLYIKLPAFNSFGYGLQTLAEVSPFTFVIPAPPVPKDVTNFSVSQNEGVVVFKWTKVLGRITGYDIGYAPVGTTVWEDFILLTNSAAGTEMTNASVLPGDWTFGIVARDIANQRSTNVTTADLTVVNIDNIIAEEPQQPDWFGTLSGLYRHYTGVLVPLSTLITDDYIPLAPPSAPTLAAVTSGALGARTYFVKITYTTDGGETLPSAESTLALLAGEVLRVTSPSVVAGASGYNVYVSLTTNTETLQTPSTIALGTDWTEPISGLVAGAAMPTQNTTGFEPFNVPVPNPVTDGYYISPTIDTAYDSDLRIFAQMVGAMLPLQTGQPNLSLEIDTWLTGDLDPNVFIPWTIGQVYMRYLRAKILVTGILPGSVPYVTEFVPTADTAPIVVTNAIGVPLTVAPGGTTINWLDYGSRFHSPPNVQATVIAATALSGTCVNITETQGTFHVWNSAGADVGGSINWTATGE